MFWWQVLALINHNFVFRLKITELVLFTSLFFEFIKDLKIAEKKCIKSAKGEEYRIWNESCYYFNKYYFFILIWGKKKRETREFYSDLKQTKPFLMQCEFVTGVIPLCSRFPFARISRTNLTNKFCCTLPPQTMVETYFSDSWCHRGSFQSPLTTGNWVQLYCE